MEKTGLRADARRNRAKVLAAAEEAFAADGLAVPLDDIARLAGCRGSTSSTGTSPARKRCSRPSSSSASPSSPKRPAVSPTRPTPAKSSSATSSASSSRLRSTVPSATPSPRPHGIGFKADAGDDFRGAFSVLLERAQAVGAVRTDIDGDDLRALMVGCLAVERYAPGSGHLVRVVVDGLKTP